MSASELLKRRNYLPILTMNDGAEVTKDSFALRRVEMLEALRKYSYGRTARASA
jgi:hypothetical protein